MLSIQNLHLRAAFKSKGAELCSLIHLATDTETIWQADPNVWGYHAPVLFPIVGGLKDNLLHIDGKSYPLNRHGFARTSEFVVEEHQTDCITFLLKSSEQTHSIYPYDFEFRMKYRLVDDRLQQTFSVKNTGTETMFFALGGHTGFRIPLSVHSTYEDYVLEFELSEQLDRHLINSDGLFTGETQPVLVYGNKIPLSRHLFSNDALIFKSIQSRKVSLKSPKDALRIHVEYEQFPYLGIWAKPGADFVCIEPWIGCADSISGHQHIADKELMQDLEPGATCNVTYTISILND